MRRADLTNLKILTQEVLEEGGAGGDAQHRRGGQDDHEHHRGAVEEAHRGSKHFGLSSYAAVQRLVGRNTVFRCDYQYARIVSRSREYRVTILNFRNAAGAAGANVRTSQQG